MKTKRLLVFFLVIILLVLLSIYYPKFTGEIVNNSNSQGYSKESCFVNRVIDGDTLVCGNQTIRLLGINTPEKNKVGYQEAKDFLRHTENQTINVLRDIEDIDKYDRKLRYVFYENELINVEILQKGLATSFMLDGLKYEEKLRNAENYAKNNELGLWEKSKDECAKCVELVELNPSEEFFIIKNNCNFDCDLTGWVVKDDANHFFKLSSLNIEQEKRYVSEIKIWNDDGDRFFMRDEIGGLVVFYEYGNI